MQPACLNVIMSHNPAKLGCKEMLFSVQPSKNIYGKDMWCLMTPTLGLVKGNRVVKYLCIAIMSLQCQVSFANKNKSLSVELRDILVEFGCVYFFVKYIHEERKYYQVKSHRYS